MKKLILLTLAITALVFSVNSFAAPYETMQADFVNAYGGNLCFTANNQGGTGKYTYPYYSMLVKEEALSNVTFEFIVPTTDGQCPKANLCTATFNLDTSGNLAGTPIVTGANCDYTSNGIANSHMFYIDKK